MEDFTEIYNAISEQIRIDSSESEPAAGAPFGRGAHRSLDLFLRLAESFGFETHCYDGYAGEVIFGEGEEFAVLAHLDVVPAGGGWTREPFGGEIDVSEQKIYGRGAMDDKGPAVITLFALRSLKESGFEPKKKIKLIVGCNEESGWRCIDYYKAHAHMPDEGISPDADFPVIYAEKGILSLKLAFPAEGDFSSLKGGERTNMVCDRCEADAAAGARRLEELGLSLEGGKAVSYGKSAHGSTPEKGINAIPPMLEYLGLGESVLSPMLALKDRLTALKDETGALTFSPNVIRGGKNRVEIVCDIRYPATLARSAVTKIIEESGIEYSVVHEQSPLFNDKNSFLVKTLCSVYNEVTGKDARPVAIGGGTYARALRHGAAFGPEEEGEESTIHQADEYITFAKVKRCFEIYRRAIRRLTE